jgi:hypothetical protein
MRTALRRAVWGLGAGLVLVVAPVPAQIRPDSRAAKELRVSTRRVTIVVSPFDFDLTTGEAIVTLPRAIVGHGRSNSPWILTVRADSHFSIRNEGQSDKPCSDLAIRASDTPSFRPLASTPRPVKWGGDTHGRIEVATDLKFTARLTDVATEHTLELYFELTD